MDKQVVLAVAGSGKTSSLIDRVSHSDRALFVTFTNANERNLTERIIAKFGEIPAGFRIYTYFTFLYRFCFSPFLADVTNASGVIWDPPPRYAKRSDRSYFLSPSNRLYGNRIGKLIIDSVINDVIGRLEKYFDIMLVDEVQDFGGHDFDFLMHLSKANLKIICAGDFYQHTYDTSRDGNVNKSLHDNYSTFQDKLISGGFTLDNTTLQKSYRCSPSICSFITSNLGIEIDSYRSDNTVVQIVENNRMLDELFANERIVKLFFKEHYSYGCFSRNWGDTKGEDCYSDVCVVLTKGASELLQKGKLSSLAPSSRNKLYVAASRAKNNLYLVPSELLESRMGEQREAS